MKDNYQYYENNSSKEMNQQGQGSKPNKKSNYKYYKGASNKNNLNNTEEKINMNKVDHSQNYQYHRN